VTAGITRVLEVISAWMTGACLPLFYLTALVGAVEWFLALVRHPLAFKGVVVLSSRHIRERLMLPPDSELESDRINGIQYLITNKRELLFTGRPRLAGSTFVLRARAVDRGGMTLLELRASLWLCLGFLALGFLFLGLAIGSFMNDGAAAGGAFLLIGGGITWLLVWRIRAQIRQTPSLLRDILEYLNEEDVEEEEEGCEEEVAE
jgi:hypothetical protein